MKTNKLKKVDIYKQNRIYLQKSRQVMSDIAISQERMKKVNNRYIYNRLLLKNEKLNIELKDLEKEYNQFLNNHPELKEVSIAWTTPWG